MQNTKQFVHYLLAHWRLLPAHHWTVQGFGFARLRISPNLRLHIWHSSLRVPGVSDIHDHAQWAFTSEIICGRVVNERFVADPVGETYSQGVIQCGIGGGLERQGVPMRLRALQPEQYVEGDTYSQEPDEIHRSTPEDGTVTLLRQYRRATDTAHVFWYPEDRWVDAIPRQATTEELRTVVSSAIMRLRS